MMVGQPGRTIRIPPRAPRRQRARREGAGVGRVLPTNAALQAGGPRRRLDW